MSAGEKTLLVIFILFATAEPSTGIGAVILLMLKVLTAILFAYWPVVEKLVSRAGEKEK